MSPPNQTEVGFQSNSSTSTSTSSIMTNRRVQPSGSTFEQETSDQQKSRTSAQLKRRVYYTTQQIKSHNSCKDAWVILNGAVYDVTEFLPSHPGGEDIIIEYAGQDVTEVFKSAQIHQHSDNALETLKSYRVGQLENNKEQEDLFDVHNEFANIIDLDKPIISQMWKKQLPLDVYLRLAHTPHFMKDGKIARLFENDFLEAGSRNSWYVVLIWIPVTVYICSTLVAPLGLLTSLVVFVGGIGVWSLLEYLIHRFFFHMDGLLPDHHFFICTHFLLHGIHHFLPMDRMRLVFPPLLTFIILAMFMMIFHLFFSYHVANGLLAGGLFGYTIYDLSHYYVHHCVPTLSYFKELKSYHLNHHYKNYHLGYGVSSKTWDYVFGTVLSS